VTLPSLFRKVGIHVPRGVTVDGTVVLGDRQIQSVGAATVTAMHPHRFHGGEDPAPARYDTDRAWWVKSPESKTNDIADMRDSFSNVIVFDDENDLSYGVTLDTRRGKFDVLILPQVDGSLPTAVAVRPKRLGRNEGRKFRVAPHLYLSGALCIADSSDWEGKGYKTSVAAAWTAHWLACYSAWRINGIWPTEGYDPRGI
jgi:hypothetical protein